jgi:hypothetical protein
MMFIQSRNGGDKTMTYAPRPHEFIPLFEAPAALGRPVTRRRGLLRRWLDAVFVSREQEAERAAARYIARTGGRLTDEIERQITDRIITGNWRH